MPDASAFLHPTTKWQRRYEALRASFVERLPARVVSERFGYAPGYVHLLRHLFRHGKIDFSEVPPPGRRSRVPSVRSNCPREACSSRVSRRSKRQQRCRCSARTRRGP